MFGGVLGPVVQGGEFEVCAVGPDKGVYFGVYAHLVEQRLVAQWPVHLAAEDGLKVDGLVAGIVKRDVERVRPDNLHDADAANGV